ncbi:hypothetical protein I4U23_013037 [Adineta vaga]|nr:hypothetical protein I4U23_013037 [Adineta vaga]
MAEAVTNSYDVDRQISVTTLHSFNLKIENNLNDYTILIEFNDVESDLSHVRTLIYDTNIFLIISGTSGQEHVLEFINDRRMTNVYIYCMNVDKHRVWTKKIEQIRYIASRPNDLLIRLHIDIRELSGRWPLCEKSFQKASTATSEWYHLFLLVICHRCNDMKQSYREMFTECRAYYKNNPRMVRAVDRFAQRYKSENAIREYTRDGFLYRIINHALRTHDIPTIRKFSPFIHDIYSQLLKIYRKYSHSKEKSIRAVYREQYPSLDELTYLRSIVKSRHPIIKLMTFSSTSLDPNIALDFMFPIPDRIPCLFEIIITDSCYDQQGRRSHYTQVFANISSISVMPDEQEVLFSPMANFRVKFVGDPTIQSDRPWVSIVLELVLHLGGIYTVSYLNIMNRVEVEKDPKYYTDILDMLQANAIDKLHFKQTNWQYWWNELIKQWRTVKAREEPILLIFYDCFIDNKYWLRKAVELRKNIHRSGRQLDLNYSTFLTLFKQFQGSQYIPTKWIALYEDYMEPFCIKNSKEVIECLLLAGRTYETICDWDRALECYQKGLQLDSQNEHCLNNKIELQIKNLQKRMRNTRMKNHPHTITTTTTTVAVNIVQENLDNYETQDEQWSIYWALQHDTRPNIFLKKKLTALESYLIKRKAWLYASDIMIVLCIPYQDTPNLLRNINQCFISAMRKNKLLYDDSMANAMNNRSLCLWRYERYIHEWILFSELEKFFKSFQEKSSLIRLVILPRLVKLMANLSLLITVCAAYIYDMQDSTSTGKVKTDSIRFIDINNLKIKQLRFFDLNDPNLRTSLQEYQATCSVAGNTINTNTDNIKGIMDKLVFDIKSDQLKLSAFRVRLTENKIKIKQLLEPSLLDHEFISLLKNTLVSILQKWNSSETQSLNETDRLTFHSIAIFFSEIAENFNSYTSSAIYQPFLSNMPLIQIIQQCLETMASSGKHLNNSNDEYNLESFSYLLNVFRNFDTQSGHSIDEIISIFPLLISVSNLIRSKYYTETFLNLSHNANEFTIQQRFLLDRCSGFLNAYKGKRSSEIHDLLLEQIFNQYVQILEHFLSDIQIWTSPVIIALTHVIDTMISASSTAQIHIFQHPKIIEYVLMILRNQRLCSKLPLKQMTPETWLINSILTGLHNMIYDPKLLSLILQKTVTPTFLNITNVASYDRIRIHAYLILASILSEAEIKQLNNAKEITEVFFTYLSEAMKSRERMFRGVTMVAILCGLKTLVQHDEIKSTILALDKDLRILSKIIFDTNGQELAHALSILWTLSFNKNVALTIIKNSELMNRIRILATKTKSNEQGNSSDHSLHLSNDELMKIKETILSAAQGILWQIQGEIVFIEQQQQKQDKEKQEVDVSIPQSSSSQPRPISAKKKKYDVMISYSHDDKELCHRIADQLIKDGFNVWIDKNNMSGSTPTAIADGIENSEIVLIGMTYSYKISPWCQREGNYAFQRQTKIIPLKLPPAYSPDGWLGLLVANLNYINFSKLDFQIAYDQLKAEIRKCQHQTFDTNKVANETDNKKSLDNNEYIYPPQSDGSYATIPIQSWTQQHVTDFMNDKNLYPLTLLCKGMDGSALHQLFTFCNENPTVSFQSLQKKLENKFNNYDLSPIEYTCFISEMKKLK